MLVSTFIPKLASHVQALCTVLTHYITALALLLDHLMGQYCFARWCLSSVVVCNAAGVRAGRTAGAWAVGHPQAGRVGSRATDTAWWASTVTSRHGNTLLHLAAASGKHNVTIWRQCHWHTH